MSVVRQRRALAVRCVLASDEREASAVEGDRLLADGDASGELLVLQSVLGVRIQRHPGGGPGYNPMAARVMLKMQNAGFQ